VDENDDVETHHHGEDEQDHLESSGNGGHK
jgi:hypothetical protein